jgi:hypothetical protein
MDGRIELNLFAHQEPRRASRRSTSCAAIRFLHIFQCKCKDDKKHSSCNKHCFALNHDCCSRSHYWKHVTKALGLPPGDYEVLSEFSKDREQIELDLTRTFPSNSYFASYNGTKVLSRLLNRLANYIPEPGYVQGLNYICAALLWHSSETTAFWLAVKLMTDYKLSENYLEGLPGLMKFFEVLEGMMKRYLPKLAAQLEENGILPNMFATDWCMTLFTNVIPLKKTGKFFTYFFEEGWTYVYKLCLEILDRLKKRIEKLEDRLEIVGILKPFQLYSDHQERFLESLTVGFERKNWDNILGAAKKRKIVEISEIIN